MFSLLILVSCSKSNHSSNPTDKIHYSYGSEELPGNLPPLRSDYRPKNLNNKIFELLAKTYAPFNFISQNLTLTFDVKTNLAQAESTVQFKLSQNAYAYFELQAPVSRIEFEGASIPFHLINDPEGENQTFVALDQELSAGTHEIKIEYALNPAQLTFTGGGVRLLTSMTDLNGKFFEYWAPVSFEDDAFTLELNLKILNSSSTHQLISNGQISHGPNSEWKIKFPPHFTKSSFYIHLTNATDLTVRKFTYKNIPITVYGSSASLVDESVAGLPPLFDEFENDYGPYAHPAFIAYMHTGSGGMEYAGATITSFGSLDHELLHSWFARGVMPADGRSGWIDEAIASWRDYGYFQAESVLTRSPTNLANYSPFRKTTPRNSYADGRQLIAELDREFLAFGGMKPLLRLFFDRYKYQVVTNEEFWLFLSSVTLINIDSFFERYTLGEPDSGLQAEDGPDPDSKHPLPLTDNEILNLR